MDTTSQTNTTSNEERASDQTAGSAQPLLGTQERLGFLWPTIDPFLFLAHHRDEYPRSDGAFGPADSLSGRQIGSDFSAKDGWSMYHGDHVPGFPRHPHRGFETITYVREGMIDHSDSMGATARFGEGDTQWMTAGGGVEHCEMFPLLHEDKENPAELFQLWLNLPAKSKMVPPYFTMMWSEDTPVVTVTDEHGNEARVVVLIGQFGDKAGVAPPPDSWAASAHGDVTMLHFEMGPNSSVTVPAARLGLAEDRPTQRMLYLFGGGAVTVDAGNTSNGSGAETLAANHAARLAAGGDVTLTAGPDGAELLLLQGRPIGEPVVQHGPFVMNSPGEIRKAMIDYHEGKFGRWPWGSDDPIHKGTDGRFAQRPNLEREFPPTISAAASA